MENCARWWREWEFWATLAVVVAVYCSRLGDALPNGEEPRRGQVAREMIRSGDWIVPRQQGEPFLSRPPVQNWAIALVALARGQVDTLAIRIPSGIAMLLTSTLIYAFSRRFLSRLGAMSAMIAFPTMGLVLQFGWLGETEAIYTLVVASSLMLWRIADADGKRPLTAWCAGYGLAAVGMLTKGPQAPVYFIGGAAIYLLIAGRWRDLFRWQHVVGIVLFLTIWLGWEIPFYRRVGSQAAWTMLAGDIGMRFQDPSWTRTLKHFVEFPLSVLACMLPWCFFLLAYFRRDFRNSIGFARDEVRFLSVAIGFAFLSCYLVPGARNRYLAPIFPLVAPLIGLVAQQCYTVAFNIELTKLRQRFFLGMSVAIAGLAAWIGGATVFHVGPFNGEQPAAFAICYVLAAFGAIAAAIWASRRAEPLRHRLGILAIGSFLGLTYIGAIVNIFVATRHPIGDDIAEVVKNVPADVELVSIGPVDDVFLYYYGKPIKKLPVQDGSGKSEPKWTYFCMGCGPEIPPFNYPYEKLGVVSVESAYSANPHDVVIIGRRLSDSTAGRTADNVR